MKTIITILITLSLTLISGCGYKEGVVAEDPKAYIYFTGQTENALVSIDNSAQFTVKRGRNNQYVLTPGKHIIEVYKNGELVIKRELFFSDGVAREVRISQ